MPEPRAARPAPAIALPAVASLLAAVAVLVPPEIHPWSQAACQALAAALLILAAFGRPAIPLRPPAWLALLAACALAPVLAAACRARALDEAVYAGLLVVAGLAGRSIAGRGRGAARLGVVLAILGVAVTAHAAVQRFVTYPALAAALEARDPADPTGVLVRLQAGRPSGPFLLPAALGGFLALALPWVLLRAVRGRDRRGRSLAAGAAALLCGGLLLSRSLGALAAAGAGFLVILPALAGKRRRPAAAAIGAVLMLGAAWFAWQRDDVRAAPGGNPLTLRAGNWGAALRMVADRPVLGVGPGSFAVFYPRTMRPGMNEARHAHNSWLEAAAGWGFWILAPLGLLALAWVRAVGDRLERAGGPARAPARGAPDDRLALLAGGGTFLVHNLGDFTAFLPGVAIPAALAIGCGLGAGPEDDVRPAAPGRAAGRFPAIRRATLAGLAILLAAHGAATSRSRSLLDAAQTAAAAGDAQAAIDRARASRDARPDHPDPRAFLAQAILAEHPGDARRLAEGEIEAEAALRLDPESAILHWTRALYHDAAGRPGAAWRERAAARRLYPLKELYRQPDVSGTAAAAVPAAERAP